MSYSVSSVLGVEAPAWSPVLMAGAVDTVEEVLARFLNASSGHLAGMTVSDLDAVIQSAQKLKNLSPEQKSILATLVKTRDAWKEDLASAVTPFQREAIDSKYQLQLVDTFNLGLANEKTFSGNRQKILDAVALAELISNGTSNWSNAGNRQTEAQVDAVLRGLDKLDQASLQALGLDGFKADLLAARNAYEAARKNIPNNASEQDRTLAERRALSEFRSAVATARIAMLTKQGGAGAAQAIAHEQRILNQEKLWLDNLNTPWQTEKFSRLPTLSGIKDLEAYRNDLLAIREQELAKGNTVGVEYLDARIAIVDRTLEKLSASGMTTGMAALMEFLNMASDLVALDLADANGMLEKAKAGGADAKTDEEKQANRELIKKFEELVNRITEIMGQLTKLTTDMADRFYESVQSIR